MRAQTGDRMITHGRTVGEPDRVTRIVEILGENGAPPYRVRDERGHETVVSPGPDTVVEHPGGG
ncbi:MULTISPECIES: DUF1918 domain-containing protein [Streptomyces]|uniref:DUF1918 domain-containing protein n=1 Tax=Streptomyces TaxID=1883 RepID=UPI000CD59C44|nr:MULTISPECIES: DUF1918 domain-containing protein [Streptomyces]